MFLFQVTAFVFPSPSSKSIASTLQSILIVTRISSKIVAPYPSCLPCLCTIPHPSGLVRPPHLPPAGTISRAGTLTVATVATPAPWVRNLQPPSASAARRSFLSQRFSTRNLSFPSPILKHSSLLLASPSLRNAKTCEPSRRGAKTCSLRSLAFMGWITVSQNPVL